MSIKSLVDYIGENNISDGMDKEKLSKIALQVIERADKDRATMKEWMDCVDKGIELSKPEFNGKDSPWPGSANFKSTILTEAANQFGNKATVELMRDPRLVKASIVGAATIRNVIDKRASQISQLKKDLEGYTAQITQLQEMGQDTSELEGQIAEIQQQIEADTQKIKEKKRDLRAKDERADRVTELMNWQVNTSMCEWRDDHTRLMYSLPNIGTMFKKTFYDETKGRCFSDVVCYPDFIVNQRTKNLEDGVFTHIITFSRSEYETRVKSKVWRDLEAADVEIFHDKDLGTKGTNEEEDAEKSEDNPDKYYEQYTWLDLDDDGISEPYVVTVHVSSLQVVRIVARYDYDGVIVRYKNKNDEVVQEMKPMPLVEAQKKRAALIELDAKEFNIEPVIPDANDLSGYQIVRIEPKSIITKYGLIPSADGTYLDVGYYWLIGSAVMAVNMATNDLLNAGTQSNLQGGIVAKGFRKKPGTFTMRMGEFVQTEVPLGQLANSIMPLPYKEPSPTLFALNDKMEAGARSFAANVDAGGQLTANTAPTTALALIQETLIQHTAHMTLINNSMSKEFKILFALNRDYLDDTEYQEIVGDEEAVFSEDFNTDGLSVVCGANPEMSSRMQRMMLSEAEMSQVPMVIQAGGNPIPIIKNYYKRIGSDNLDEIFPNEAEMSPEDKAQMQAMKQATDMQNQMAQQQLQMVTLQTELLKRAEDRKDQEFLVASKEQMAKIDKLLEEVTKVKAETILTLEKAETEQVKNQISIYTAASNELDKAEKALLPAEDQE